MVNRNSREVETVAIKSAPDGDGFLKSTYNCFIRGYSLGLLGGSIRQEGCQ
jgi:hypothetical protein